MSKVLINESRCKNASSEINIMFSERTTPSQYAAFKKLLEAYLRSRPQEFIGDSLFVYIMGVAPSHFIQVITHTDDPLDIVHAGVNLGHSHRGLG